MLPSDPVRKIISGLGVCLVASLSAALSYVSAGWGWLDATYMVIITLFGIGYGEVHPVDGHVLKLQTMALIVVGCLSGLYSVGGFFQLLAEGEIKRVLGLQKMSRGIKRMKNHTIICGYGRVGKKLAGDLSLRKLPFVVVDSEQSRVEEAEREAYNVVAGDATCDDVLRSAGIMRANALATVLPNDAINVFITLTARDLHAGIEIIARAECPRTERKLRRSGADHVIMPASIGAIRMAQIICDMQDEDDFGPQILHPVSTSLKAIPVCDDDALADTTLQLARETVHEIGQVIGVQRGSSEILTNVDDTAVLKPGDVLLLNLDKA